MPPQLELKVRPKLGEREVTFLHVTEWIEKKLQHEFQVPGLLKGSANPTGIAAVRGHQTSGWVGVLSAKSRVLNWSGHLWAVRKHNPRTRSGSWCSEHQRSPQEPLT